MAETPIIKIGTEQAVQNVADLKNNIKELKKQLDDATTSTEEYSNIVLQLSQNQAALRNVMNGTNSTFETSIKDAQGLTTSYNSLVQQLKTATQEWRTIPKYLSDADQAQGKINKAWTEAATKVEKLRMSLKDMDAATGNFTRNVGNYKSALDGFQGALNNVKQVGGDMNNGISAISSMMLIAGADTEGITSSMKNFYIVLGLVQGAKGLTGLVKSLANFVKGSKNATTATKAETTATNANAAAMTADATATSTATVATTAFGTALKAIGIGLIVSAISLLVTHLEDIVKWFAKAGESLGLWKKRTNEAKEANDALNKKMDEQTRAFDLNARLQQAQGVEQKKILQDKLKLIKSYINEKNAIIAAANARIEEIKGHTWLQRVLKGENRERRQLLKDIEQYQKEVKSLNDQKEEIEIDIQVEDANKGRNAAQKAAAKAKEDAAKALKLSQEITKKGTDTANKALEKQRTTVESINEAWKADKKAIKDAIAELKKMPAPTGDTAAVEAEIKKRKEQEKTLTLGLKAREQQYYSDLYTQKLLDTEKKVTTEKQEQYRVDEERIAALKLILGYTDEQVIGVGKVTAEQRKEYDILKAQVDMLKNDIEPDIFSNIDFFRGMTPEEIAKEVGQPTATAIQKFFEKNDEFQQVGKTIVSSLVSGYNTAIDQAIDRNEFQGAAELARNFYDQLAPKMKELGLGDEFIKYFKETIDKTVAQAMSDSNMPQGFLYNILFPQSDKVAIEFKIQEIQRLITEAMGELADAISNGAEQSEIDALTKKIEKLEDTLATLQERMFNFNIGRFSQVFKDLGKYLDTYGKATANVMDNVADAWEAALQAQVKSGKMGEEQAKKSFESVKALQLAGAIINTSAAVVQALADPTTPSYYLKAANAAAALAAGIAQVIKIKNTEFSASVSSTSSSATPQMVDRTPQLQYTIGLNSADYAYEISRYPTRAYVVDKDLADGLQNYNRREDETTF